MHQIQIETFNSEVIEALKNLAKEHPNIDIIQSKNFSGDLTCIEVYLPLITATIIAITPIIIEYIKNKKISSVKIDGKKIEFENISEKTAKEFMQEYLNSIRTAEENNIESEDNNESY